GTTATDVPSVGIVADWSGTVSGNVAGTTDEGGADNKPFSLVVGAQPDGIDQTESILEGTAVSGNIFTDDVALGGDLGGASSVAGLTVTGVSGFVSGSGYWEGTTLENGTLRVFENGDYTYTAPATVGHIASDTLPDGEFTISYNDGIGPDVTQTLTLNVLDDEPTITNSLDALLVNEEGNILSGIDLDIDTGADIPVSIILTPEVDVDGFAIDTNDNLLTSTVGDNTYNLVYLPTVGGTTGSVTAYQYIDASTTGDPIFTLTPDMSGGEYTGTYSVLIDGQLDGAAYSYNIDLSSGTAYSGGNQPTLQFIVPDATPDDSSDNLHVLATAYDGTEVDTVNYNPSNGLGVGDGGVVSYGERLILNLTESDNITPLSVTDASFTLARFSSGETAYWQAYDGDTLVGEGYVSGEGNEAHQDGVADLNANIIGMEDSAFDQIIFTCTSTGKNDGYSLTSMDVSYDYDVAGTPHSINVDVDVTDSDLDIASGDIEITFDEDGVIYDVDDTGDTLVISDTDIDFSALAVSDDNAYDTIDLRADPDTVTNVSNLTLESVFDMTDHNNILNILGDEGDSLEIVDTSTWSSKGEVEVSGTTYNQYQGTYSDISGDQTVTLNVQDTIDEEIV
ncbi:MAG: hypothetical protein U9R16_06985, partial [Campylobacterota bacterium]|nr:hypothetical protein [Campylobacterota bacterium]